MPGVVHQYIQTCGLALQCFKLLLILAPANQSWPCSHADAPRSLTCMAMEEGALLVQIPQRLFLGFIASRPRTLQIYLQKVTGPEAALVPAAELA